MRVALLLFGGAVIACVSPIVMVVASVDPGSSSLAIAATIRVPPEPRTYDAYSGSPFGRTIIIGSYPHFDGTLFHGILIRGSPWQQRILVYGADPKWTAVDPMGLSNPYVDNRRLSRRDFADRTFLNSIPSTPLIAHERYCHVDPVTHARIVASGLLTSPQSPLDTLEGFHAVVREAIPRAMHDCIQSALDTISRATRSVVTVTAGWPLRSFTCEITTGRLAFPLSRTVQGGILIDDGVTLGHSDDAARAVPLTPIWSGLLVNTAFFATLLWGMPLGSRRLLIVLRARRRNCCSGCGYPLKVSGSTRCPECGAAVVSRAPATLQAAPSPAELTR